MNQFVPRLKRFRYGIVLMSNPRRGNMYLLVALALAIFLAPMATMMPVVFAQGSDTSMQGGNQTAMTGENLLKLRLAQRMVNSSVSIGDQLKAAMKDKLTAKFADLVATAQKEDPNSKIVAARITNVHDSLVYRFVLVNLDTRTIHVVFIDPGNGKVLASPQIELRTLAALLHRQGMIRAQDDQSHPILKLLAAQRMANGSVSIGDQLKAAIKDKVTVNFANAVATAQKEDPNGKVVAARITLVHDSLVWRVVVVNFDTRTIHVVFIDPGNGKVLASPQIELRTLAALLHWNAVRAQDY
jgi:uncharacterized protein (DUF1786 family)